MQLHNLFPAMTLIERTVAVSLDAEVLGIVFTGEIAHSRSGGEEYWENTYIVAWQNERECGTHQANVNSESKCALFYGHFQLTEMDARADMVERANLTVGRI
jgi:hypothetical protein